MRGLLESAPVTCLLLVRHGQSEWNAQGRWRGRADPPLTDLGRAQARHAAASLPAFDRLAASTLVRAHETAREIADELGRDDLHLEPDLMERDAGGFSGLTREEIDHKFPGYLGNDIWPEGWETDEELVPRVRGALDRLVTLAPGGTIVAITHGGCIYALERLLGADFERISNLGGRWFTLDGAGLVLGDRVHLLSTDEETVPDQL